MKRKLFIALHIVTIVAVLISTQVYHAMKEVTFKLENIITIYKIQPVREKLGLQLRGIQEELLAKDTPNSTIAPQTIMADVEEMTRTMHSCFACHHQEPTAALLQTLSIEIDGFKTALGRAFANRANPPRTHEATAQTYEQGRQLLAKIDGMLAAASATMEAHSHTAMAEVKAIMRLMTLSIFALPVCLLLTGLYFMRSITRPITALLRATTELGQGRLDYRVSGLKDEFGRLGNAFNVMAESLTNQRQVTQRAEQMSVVGQMAVGLAHEIKNPLAGIKVSMEVLKGESYIHDQDRQVLAMVIAVINRINSLINDLLNFARPSAPRLQSIPVNRLLEQTIDTAMHTRARPQGAPPSTPPALTCKTELAADLPNVQADPGQVQQIVLNLLVNAFDAMPQGGCLTVASALAPERGCVAITISDSGPGVSADLRDKIFVPFFSTKRKGTGLGLAICQTLAATNGGEIRVNDPVAGNGASFTLFLPIAADQGARP